MLLARALLFILTFGILVAPLAAEAQQPGKVPRLGYLLPGSPSDAVSQRLRNTFLERLRELGYVEGQNIAIDYRAAEGRDDRLPGLAEELVRLKVDVILVAGHHAGDPGGQTGDQRDPHRYGSER